MGVGLGGDYPLSSVITAEFATTRWRGAMMAAVFSMQGLGQLLASLVAFIAVEASKGTLLHPDNYCLGKTCSGSTAAEHATDRIWRIVIGFGAVPAAAALYFRLTIPETPRYTFDVGRDVEQAFVDTLAWAHDEIGPLSGGQGRVPEERQGHHQQLRAETGGGLDPDRVPRSSWSDFRSYYGRWRNARVLLGTAGSWFLLDVVFFGISLNNPVILRQIGYGFLQDDSSRTKQPLYSILRNNALGNMVLVCVGAIPGYLVTVLLVDRIGRKFIQLQGFAILTVLFLVLGFVFNRIGDNAKLAFYVLYQFFFNFGAPGLVPLDRLWGAREKLTSGQARMPQPSSCRGSAFRLATGAPATESRQRQASWGPSWPRPSSAPCADEGRPRTRATARPGWPKS